MEISILRKGLLRNTLSALLTLALISSIGQVSAQEKPWTITAFSGRMTDQNWETSIVPWKTHFVDSGLIGVGIGRDWALRNPRFSLGFEAQIVQHFGRQDHWETNVPIVLRFRPDWKWPERLESLAFGIGVSYAAKVPKLEIDLDGSSSQTLVYWMGELEFDVGLDNSTLVTRIHHRSDAYGLLPVNAGSNALVLGLRWSF